jgi:hypothetical protein
MPDDARPPASPAAENAVAPASGRPGDDRALQQVNGPLPSPNPDPQDRRATVRRRRLIRVRISDPGVLFEPYMGWIVDRSLGGFCLSVDQPIEEGQFLRLRATDAPQNIPWVEVHVKRCQQRDASWEVGCEFVHRPSWEAMLTFG